MAVLIVALAVPLAIPSSGAHAMDASRHAKGQQRGLFRLTSGRVMALALVAAVGIGIPLHSKHAAKNRAVLERSNKMITLPVSEARLRLTYGVVPETRSGIALLNVSNKTSVPEDVLVVKLDRKSGASLHLTIRETGATGVRYDVANTALHSALTDVDGKVRPGARLSVVMGNRYEAAGVVPGFPQIVENPDETSIGPDTITAQKPSIRVKVVPPRSAKP